MNDKEYKLTPAQLKRWEECKAKLILSVPAFSFLLHKMMNPDDSDNVICFTKDCATMATDGKRIMAGPDYFFSLTLKQQVAGCCHEIGHAMFMHLAQGHVHMRGQLPVVWKNKSLPYHPKIANFAQDFVINDMLYESGVGELKEGWLHDRKIGTCDMSWQEVYHRIFEECKKAGGKGGTGDGSGSRFEQGQFDEHLPPGATSGQDPDSSEAQPSPQQWQQAIIGAMTVARGAGRLPESLERMFEEMLKPKIHWTDHIEALFARHVGGSSYDYRRLDRRLITRNIGAPGKSGKGAGTIVIGADSSGSIYAVDHLIERFFAEVGGILEDLRPRRIVLVWCDAKVQRVDDIEDPADLQAAYYKGSKGGGGTSFVPVFEHIEEMGLDNVDALVYLTDGDGQFPDREPTDYPVIWGDISGSPAKYPWGQVVQVPNDGSA